jgi:hypothetical protein
LYIPANHIAITSLNGLLETSIYDEYQIVISEAQRRLIMRALTNGMANDRRSTDGGALSRSTPNRGFFSGVRKGKATGFNSLLIADAPRVAPVEQVGWPFTPGRTSA